MKEEDDGIFFFSNKKKQKHKEKNCKEGRELTFLLSLLLLG
jgi:hypothetical protein